MGPGCRAFLPCLWAEWMTFGRGAMAGRAAGCFSCNLGLPSPVPPLPRPWAPCRCSIPMPSHHTVKQSRLLLQWAVDSCTKHPLLMLPRRARQAIGYIRNQCTSHMDCFPFLPHLSILSGCLHACPLLTLPNTQLCSWHQLSPGGNKSSYPLPSLGTWGSSILIRPCPLPVSASPARLHPALAMRRRQRWLSARGSQAERKTTPARGRMGSASQVAPGSCQTVPPPGAGLQRVEGIHNVIALPAAGAGSEQSGEGFFSSGSFLRLQRVILLYPHQGKEKQSF